MNGDRSIVAVVDDDPRLVDSLENLFESAGYLVRPFLSAGSLLASGLTDLDVLITDIGMPGIDGFVLRDLVKEARPDLPVFMITGRREIADLDRAHGVTGFFHKPFDGRLLLAAVADALRDPRNGG